MKIVYDLDGTICENGSPDKFATAVAFKEVIEDINNHYDLGDEIIIHTARLAKDRDITKTWLKEHGVKYHELLMGKPTADLYVDDKAIPFMPAKGPQLNRKKLCVCLSGGMDSYIAYWYAIYEKGYDPEDIICLNFDIGHPYRDKEKECLDKLEIPYTTIHLDILRPEFGNMPDEKNYIIPARNMIFASIASGFAERVWIMGMKYEDHYHMLDKNSNFFKAASFMLSQATGNPTVVETPFKNLTKTDIINWAKNFQLPHLHDTTSCYNPDSQRCGKCSLCFKRYIAMKACGLDEEFDEDPTQSEEAKRLIEAYREAVKNNDYTHYQKDRIEETFKVLGLDERGY